MLPGFSLLLFALPAVTGGAFFCSCFYIIKDKERHGALIGGALSHSNREAAARIVFLMLFRHVSTGYNSFCVHSGR